ncbi:MAG: hypothetical protein ABIS92_13100 [Polyangia bacterium]
MFGTLAMARAEPKSVPFFQKPSLTPERDVEKRTAELSTPQALRSPEAPIGERTRTLRVRVYGDLDYRAVTPHWQARVRSLFERVNAFVEPGFSVHFELQSLRSWDRRSAGAPLAGALAALEALDAGADVDWVIGLASALPGVTNDIHELGLAPLLGRHFVLRGTDDPAEALSMERNLHRLTNDERAELYRSRKQHRETVIFLHEWAHTLGALHDLEPDRIMNAQYRTNQTSLSADNIQIMRLDLDARVGPSFDPRPLLAFVESRPFDDTLAQDRETLLRLLRDQGARATPPPSALPLGAPLSPPRPPPPFARPNPATPTRGTATNPPANTHELAEAVRALIANGHRDEARARVEAAKRTALGDPKRSAPFVAVAGGYRELGAVTLAEQALALAGDTPGTAAISRWASETRGRAGLPKDAVAFKITLEDEPAYLDLVGRIDGHLRANADQRANPLIREGLDRYPGAPGLLALRCDVELRAGRPQIARRTCTAALKPDGGAARAHALLASMDLDAGHRDDARAHLLRALALNPDDRDAMEMLLHLHR